MKFIPAVVNVFKNYFNFKDRAPRSEYWWFMLFCVLLGLACAVVDGVAFSVTNPNDIGPASAIANLATLIPSISVTARRLHDVDRSGWWMLIAFTIIGVIPLIYWYCKKGTDGPNRFGADPLSFYMPGRKVI